MGAFELARRQAAGAPREVEAVRTRAMPFAEIRQSQDAATDARQTGLAAPMGR
jgi:hypothetical protein